MSIEQKTTQKKSKKKKKKKKQQKKNNKVKRRGNNEKCQWIYSYCGCGGCGGCGGYSGYGVSDSPLFLLLTHERSNEISIQIAGWFIHP